MTATARAYPNIALIKYWGKADEELMLPVAGSLSMTLDAFPTTTQVRRNNLGRDTMRIGGREATERELSRASRLLGVVREWAAAPEFAAAGASAEKREWYVDIDTRNEAPTGAGMASSASGFAALATAAAREFGLNLSARDLSRLARRGSGSATRSITPGMAVWHAGSDEESFAEEVPAPQVRMVCVITSNTHKKVTSREAMRITAQTSPYYGAWIAATEEMLAEAIEVAAAGDFARLGQLTEMSALRMHAAIEACEPPIRYLAPVSWEIFDLAARLRESGIPVYATADAGPNVVLLTLPEYADEVAAQARQFGTVVVCGPGPGAQVIAADGAATAV